jgi:prepilin-type N-terminal cleavage/methylation domain-containing protein
MKTQFGRASKGFSLVELMVAVAVIGILTAQARANFERISKIGLLRTELAAFTKKVVAGREMAGGEPIHKIEERVWGFQTGGVAHTCPGWYNSWAGGLVGVVDDKAADCVEWNTAEWKLLGFDKAPTTPWGGVFMIDANEAENGWGGVCLSDYICAYAPPEKKMYCAEIPPTCR